MSIVKSHRPVEPTQLDYQPGQYSALHAGTMVNGGLETSMKCSVIKMT